MPASNCFSFLLGEVKSSCECANVGQMLIKCVSSLALHLGRLLDSAMIQQRQNVKSELAKTLTGWGAIRKPVGVFSLSNVGGAERNPFATLREQFL